MVRRSGGSGGSTAEEGDRRILIQDAAGPRPFMRGILVHSLMARGLSFEDAYATAKQVRDRLRELSEIDRRGLAKIVQEVLGDKDLADESLPFGLPRPTMVTEGSQSTPFSKGFLAQSLRAAAIDPSDAFDVAREIEHELHVRDLREIDRRELRRLAYETLSRRLGPRTAERYLVWRHFQDPERPVILLLGGTTGAGKTALALEVSNRLGIHRVSSTDSIRQIMRIMLSQDLMPILHRSSYDAHEDLPPGSTVEDPVIEGFNRQASVVSVGVRAMIDRAIAENQSLILDGVSILPGMIDLEDYVGLAHVVFLVVATLDVHAFRSRFEARGRGESRTPHRYLENLEAILEIQDYLLERAEAHGVPIVDNESFDASVLSIIRHVTETLRKEGNFDAAELL